MEYPTHLAGKQFGFKILKIHFASRTQHNEKQYFTKMLKNLISTMWMGTFIRYHAFVKSWSIVLKLQKLQNVYSIFLSYNFSSTSNSAKLRGKGSFHILKENLTYSFTPAYHIKVKFQFWNGSQITHLEHKQSVKLWASEGWVRSFAPWLSTQRWTITWK